MNGLAVRGIRTKLDMTQNEFAKELGVSQACICAVENGHRNVSSGLRIKIAQRFGTGDEIIEAITRAKESAKLAL
ncbi:hypothetical protein YSY43_15780 [Paenibacillus sp. YSY-4.3]